MDRSRGLAFGLISAALFGVATPLSKGLVAEISPAVLAGLLYLGAAVGLSPFVLRPGRGLSLPRDSANRRRLAGAVFFGGIVGPVLLLFGLELSRAASVSMLLSLETVATALLALAIFREHIGRWAWFAIGGVVLASSLLAFEGGRPSLLGAVLVAGACIAWGLDNNLTALIDGITPTQSTFWKGAVAGTANLALGMALTPCSPSSAWLSALAIGGLSYGASIVLYIHSAQALGATRSQMLFATSPVFGVVAAMLWLGEALSTLQLAAAVILAVSLTLLLFERHGHRHTHEVVDHEHSHRHDDGHHDHQHPDAPVHGRHSHRHRHEQLTHSHPHWPDLHHRHTHDGDGPLDA